VNCEQARLQIGAEPGASTPELEEHLRTCPACRGFREEMRQLDGKIRRALERAPEEPRVLRREPRAAWRQWALAASAVLATCAALGVWVLRPSDTLAREVVAHVQKEPESWLGAQQVSAADISDALRSAGVTLDPSSERIVYAHSCWFRGHYVPHLVLQTVQGPATVMILRHEPVRGRREFHEAGMSGVIVPAGHGSIAVLTRGSGAVAELAGQMQHDVQWLPQQR